MVLRNLICAPLKRESRIGHRRRQSRRYQRQKLNLLSKKLLPTNSEQTDRQTKNQSSYIPFFLVSELLFHFISALLSTLYNSFLHGMQLSCLKSNEKRKSLFKANNSIFFSYSSLSIYKSFSSLLAQSSLVSLFYFLFPFFTSI